MLEPIFYCRSHLTLWFPWYNGGSWGIYCCAFLNVNAPEPRPLPPLVLAPQTSPGTQTEPQLAAATSAGGVFPETGQFLLLCSLQLWQHLQHCHQTHARMQAFWTHYTSVLRKQFSTNNTFLWEANSYKRVLTLRNSRLMLTLPTTSPILAEMLEVINLALEIMHV